MPDNQINYSSYSTIPAYELMPSKSEIEKINRGKVFIPCEAGRGCSFNCAFCCSSSIWNRRVVFFNTDIILKQLDEIRARYGEITIYFTCDNLIYNHDLIDFLCKALKGRELKWQCRGRLDIDCDYEKLYNSGCEMIMVGIESAQSKTWKKIQKGRFPEDIIAKISDITNIGLGVTATYIVGFPFETRFDVSNTLLHAIRVSSNPNSDVSVHALTPLPKTAIYDSYQDIHFNNGTDLVRGLEFSDGLLPIDVSLIKSDANLFLGFYSFNCGIDNIISIAETATALCKTSIFTNALLEYCKFTIDVVFNLSEDSYEQEKLERKIITLIDTCDFLKNEEKIVLRELFEIESCLRGLKQLDFEKFGMPQQFHLARDAGFLVILCSYNFSKIFNSRLFSFSMNMYAGANSYAIIFNPSNKKYVLLKTGTSIENIVYSTYLLRK
ncbi:MAG: radical SAM protein [Oscillospiraceae bacterium]|nr:radical SAM protein [Oscillospiraceae bacterium]